MKNSIVFLILTAVIFAVFGSALFNRFVWDDQYLVAENPYIKHVDSIPKFFSGDLSEVTSARHIQSGYYRPLSMLSFWGDYQLWRLNPIGYHLTNVVLHLLNAFLVYLIVLSLSKSQGVSLLTSVFFAVHPIQVEAVAPIFNRMGVQSAFFMLLALFFLIRSEGLNKISLIIGVLTATLLGLFSKEDAVILPFLFLSYDYFYLKQPVEKKCFPKKRVLFYASCLFICCLYLATRAMNVSRPVLFPYLGFGGAAKYDLAPTFFTHVLSVFKILGHSFLRIIYPVNLSPVYLIEPAKRIVEPLVLTGLLVVGILFITAFWTKNKSKEIEFSIFLFLVGILPASNLIPLSHEYIARDHFLYFPSVGLFCLAAYFVKYLFNRFKEISTARTFIKSAVLAIVLGLMSLSFSYTFNWRADFILWRYTLKLVPQSPLAHLNLAHVFLRDKNLGRAEAEFNKFFAVSNGKNVAGDFIYSAKLGLASVYLLTEKYGEAIPLIEQALIITQNTGIVPFEAYNKLGLAYAYLNDYVKAEENLKKSLSYNKDFINARYNLGVFYYYRGEYKKSEEELNYALKLDPDFADGIVGLGLAYIKEDRKEEAQQMFLRALKINPQSDMANHYSQMLKVK